VISVLNAVWGGEEMKNAKTDDEIIRALGFKTFEVHRATFDCIFHVC
jgi:hypothetical protein